MVRRNLKRICVGLMVGILLGLSLFIVMGGLSDYKPGGGWTAYALVGNAPESPTELLVNGESRPRFMDAVAPYFSAIAQHEDAGETMEWAQVQVDDDVAFGSLLWDSGQVVIASVDDGDRCQNIVYVGDEPVWNTRYYWIIRFWDSDGDVGEWSSTSYFDYGVVGGGVYEEDQPIIFEALDLDEYNSTCNPQVYMHELFEAAATAWGYGCSRPVMVSFAMVLTVGMSVGVLVATRSIVLGIIGGMIILGGSTLMGITPWWILLITGGTMVGGWYMLSRTGV